VVVLLMLVTLALVIVVLSSLLHRISSLVVVSTWAIRHLLTRFMVATSLVVLATFQAVQCQAIPLLQALVALLVRPTRTLRSFPLVETLFNRILVLQTLREAVAQLPRRSNATG
jgi:hypothetical protein